MSQRPRIMLVTRSAHIGGVEEHVYQLALYLIKRHYSVLWVVLSGDINKYYRQTPSLHFIILNDLSGQSFTSFLLLGKIFKIVWRFKPRIVHLHGIRPMLLFSLIPFPLKVRRVSTVHASYLLMAMDSAGKTIYWKCLVSKIFHVFSCLRSDQIIVISKFIAQEVQQLVYPFLLHNIHVVYNGVDCSSNKSRLPENVAVTFHANELQVVFVGRLEVNKGVDTIIRAMADLDSSVKVRCHLLGDGYQRQQFELLSVAEEVNDRIHFWGNIPEAGKLLYAFDVLVLPSFIEGMGIAALEAMAAGLPVVASRVGGIPEAVLDGITGYLIAPGDFKDLAHRLSLLCSQKEKCEQFGRTGFQRAKKTFNRSMQLNKIVTIYNIVLR